MVVKVNPDYRKPDDHGRKPETWPPIPFENGKRVPRHLSDAIEDWLMTKRGSNRGMPVAAPLLAILCALHKEGHWLPVRRRLAEALNTGDYSIDAAISSALGHKEISEKYETEPGEVEGRASIRRRRYLIPGKELLSIYEGALKTTPTRSKLRA